MQITRYETDVDAAIYRREKSEIRFSHCSTTNRYRFIVAFLIVIICIARKAAPIGRLQIQRYRERLLCATHGRKGGFIERRQQITSDDTLSADALVFGTGVSRARERIVRFMQIASERANERESERASGAFGFYRRSLTLSRITELSQKTSASQ